MQCERPTSNGVVQVIVVARYLAFKALALTVQMGAASHRRSLRTMLSLSSLSAAELIAQHKACNAATKDGPYPYTKTRCATF